MGHTDEYWPAGKKEPIKQTKCPKNIIRIIQWIYKMRSKQDNPFFHVNYA